MAKYDATTQDGKCVFCEIASGNIKTPGLFWEDNEFMAWLAIDPNTKGLTCVIPKRHFGSDVLKMPDDVLQRFIIASKKVAAILENYFEDVGRVGLIMEGTGIDHAHIKLVPLHGTENLKRGEWKQVLSNKEFWFDKYEGWISSGSGPMADPEELKKLASDIIDAIIKRQKQLPASRRETELSKKFTLMLKRFHSNLLYASDLQKTYKFYKQLGFDAQKANDSVRVTLGDFKLVFTDEKKTPIQNESGLKPKGLGVYIYIEVENVDEYFEFITKNGVLPRTQPKTWPWGKREFVVKDPDGYKLVFYSPV